MKNNFLKASLFSTLIFNSLNINAQFLPLADVFADSSTPILDTRGFSYTQNFTPTTSDFHALDFYSERSVFNSELKYTNSNPNRSWSMRIGKGGQIYSFIGPFGESVPPQFMAGDRPENPFMDEVWQMVAIDLDLNDAAADEPYFIHQAGVYLRLDEQEEPFYSPKVSEFYNPSERSYTTINWGQQAHTEENLNAGFTADLLYYTKYTNIGNGVIQVDNMIYNFGDDTMTQLNVPWGGPRTSSLGYCNISNPNNSFFRNEAFFGDTDNIFKIEDTGGWLAFSSNRNGNGPTLGMVLNTDETNAQGLIKQGVAGNGINASGIARDFNVVSVIRRPNGDNLGPGKSMQFRYFYVLGSSVADVRSTILRNGLKNHTVETANNLRESNATTLYYNISRSGNRMQATYLGRPTNSNYSFKAQPFLNSHPIFLITGADGSARITTNLYTYGNFPYQMKATDYKLLGFVSSEREITEEGIASTSSDNLALSGIASQSSTSNRGDASRAIDGNTNGSYSNNSVTHTRREQNAHWQVNLDDEYAIGDINVFGRTDACCVGRLSNYTVLVFDENNVRTFFEVVTNAPNPSATINAGGARGKTIRVRSNTGEALSLAEVQVFNQGTSSKSITGSQTIQGNKIYPNPASTSFQIKNNGSVQKVEIYSLEGKQIKTFEQALDIYPIENLESSIYLVRILDTDGGITIKKLVKL